MKTFWSTLTIVILASGSLAGAQEQAGQPCHNNKKDPLFGLYCPTINGSFVGPKNGSQLNTTTVINGVITPITGTLTFAPGPNETPVVDDYDDSGNPICYQYDSNGNVTGTITCPSVASYDITQWDITIGAVHLVHNPLDSSVTNSFCGRGYSNSFKTDAGNSVYYICGANTDTASTGILVLMWNRAALRLATLRQLSCAGTVDANLREQVRLHVDSTERFDSWRIRPASQTKGQEVDIRHMAVPCLIFAVFGKPAR